MCPVRCSARASPNSAEACSGLIASACFKNRNGLVELLHLLIADALEVVRIRIARIELHRLLKAGQRSVEFVVRVLRQAQVVPRLRTVRIESDGRLQRLLGVVNLLQRQQRNAFVDRRLRQLRVFLERFGECLRRAR